ncbi:hypothetical protein EV361DRAFT_1010152, partial [Lentinula raphanica]
MKSFIKAILAYDPSKLTTHGGILGHVSAYYGCVEAQGRGSLHCHMLIWVEGGLNPDEIKKRVLADDGYVFRERLIAFLDDTILTSVVPDCESAVPVQASQFHPCSIRGPQIPDEHDGESQNLVQKDMHLLSQICQTHKHTSTCYKYWRGPPEPRACRFELDQSNVKANTFFDGETGELNLRKLDGLVNDFNETILAAVRCNIDIKFIGSGASAKAVMYYITDYITKSQLKAHVAYAALELAVKRLEPSVEEDDPLTVKAKKLLQRCAYSMISQQELSAQQVASYLLDFGDHFTSHTFNNLYWTSFERHLNNLERSGQSPDGSIDMATTDQGIMENDDRVDDNVEVTVSISADQVVREIPGQVPDYVSRHSKLDLLCL